MLQKGLDVRWKETIVKATASGIRALWDLGVDNDVIKTALGMV